MAHVWDIDPVTRHQHLDRNRALTGFPAFFSTVRVNETDTFGDDEERDEYFDFEDISEI